jgi:hypothetical protein
VYIVTGPESKMEIPAGCRRTMPYETDTNRGAVTISAGPRLKAALILAIIADVFQIAVFPLFVEGAASPADDILDISIGGVLTLLLGWHWEFAPSFLAKLVPGVDYIPLWTLAVANVYRKSRRQVIATQDSSDRYPAGSGSQRS